MTLLNDLKSEKNSIEEFRLLSIRVLGHLKNVISQRNEFNNYVLLSAEHSGQKRNVRPINKLLFVDDIEIFNEKYEAFVKLLNSLMKKKRSYNSLEHKIIDSITYTIQQSVGIGFDLLGESNSARKHVGNRFEELIRLIVAEMGITNRKMIVSIPYSDKEVYRCETDLIISPFEVKEEKFDSINENELVISLKTTSKDRMSKIFIDKLLMERFLNHKTEVAAIFLNDVQRKNPDKVAYTLVSNLFLVYTKFLTKLWGVYFIDPPPITKEISYRKYIKPFSKFILKDIWRIVNL